jgi:hypothetical protein
LGQFGPRLAVRFAAGFLIAFALLFAWTNVRFDALANPSPSGRGAGVRASIQTSGLLKTISKEGQTGAGLDTPEVRGEDLLLAIEADQGHRPIPKADNPDPGNP